jgi:hypothetical protein
VQTAVIGQHSAVLPMGASSAIDGGFLVAYLCSIDGSNHLQRYVSGTVQAGINLEDLRDVIVPVPEPELQKHIGDAVRRSDDFSFASRQLCLAGGIFIEAIIDGRISEDDFASAQEMAFEGDREILCRLFEGGIDAIDTRPLFPDLDAYYETLKMAEQALPDGGDE